MRISEFAKACGKSSGQIVAEVNTIRGDTSATPQSNLSDQEEGILREKFPAAPEALTGKDMALNFKEPPQEVPLKKFTVSTLGLESQEIEAVDESEAVRQYAVNRGITDTHTYKFIAVPAAAQ